MFALCGITGALYGIGQKSRVLLIRGTMETAMFVCLQHMTAMKSHANRIIVVVAWSNELCMDVRTGQDFYRIGLAPLDGRQDPSTHSLLGYWSNMCHWSCVLVHVNSSMPTGIVLLATSSPRIGCDSQRFWNLHEPRQYHCNCLRIQCHCNML